MVLARLVFGGICFVLFVGAAPRSAPGQPTPGDSLHGMTIGMVWCSGNGHTKDGVILQELLFSSGDLYEAEIIQESERNLRALPYLGHAEIVPHPHPDGGIVDLEVAVTERWALIAAVLPSLGGGRLDVELILADLNFLGRGKIVGLQSFLSSVEENTALFYFEEPRLNGTRWGGSLLLGRQGELGNRLRLEVKRPLFSLSTKWAFSGSAFDESVQRQLYSDGVLTSNYYQRSRGGEVGLLRSFRHEDRRFEIGVQSGFRHETNERVKEDFGSIPSGKRRLSLVFQLSAERFRFVRDTYFLKMGPVEDVKLGPRGSLRLGGAVGLRDDSRRYPLAGAGFTWWVGSPGRAYVTVASNVDVRVEDGTFTNVVGWTSVRLYHWVSKRGYLAWRAQGNVLARMEDPSQLRLDSGNGLRGYEAQALDGTRRILANLEWRQVVRAGRRVAIGVVGFVDAGLIWSEEESLGGAPLYVGSGPGFRLGFPTIYGAPLLRLDFGYGLRSGALEVSAGFDQRF